MLPQSDKLQLRRSLLKARQSIPSDRWRHQSDRLCSQLRDWPLFKQAQTVLAYFSVRQEPDLSPLFVLPKQWGFPRCVGKEMTWHHWSPTETELITSYPLQIGTYGILEPHPDAPIVQPHDIDLILVPALACDHRGYRLGYGGGFYDRLLSLPDWEGKSTIGIVFQDTHLPSLPRDPWDKPLQAICTETGVFLSQAR